MASKHVISMSILMAFFKDHGKQLERGENAYGSGHVIQCNFNAEMHPALIKGKVEASMKKKQYDVEVSIDLNQGTITDARCNCPRGQDICHHMAALCIFAYHNVSSTDVACAWNVPGPSSEMEIKTLSDIFPLSKPDYQPVGRLASEEEINQFKEDLAGNVVGFSWLLQPEPSQEAFIIPEIEEILLSPEYLQIQDKEEYFIQKCKLDEPIRDAVVAATIGQAANSNWLLARKHRLTASKFGAVLAACERGRYSDSFYKNLLEGYNLDGVKAVQWGAEHENAALEAFSLGTGMTINWTGLWLHPCGFLGALPDGLVNGNKLIEAKCPYKYRDMKLSDALKRDKSYIIYVDDNGETAINRKHAYYHQIQGQLHICDKQSCFLIIWTPQETQCIEIEKDIEWAPNINTLINFYLQKFIPYILGNK